MTNATVAQTQGTTARISWSSTRTAKRKSWCRGHAIVTFVAGDKSEVKPGAKVIIFSAAKKDDGTLEATRVNVGRDGITPPM